MYFMSFREKFVAKVLLTLVFTLYFGDSFESFHENAKTLDGNLRFRPHVTNLADLISVLSGLFIT